jgi:two-component system copper resistance phosphate regulon response regulator CusR
MSDILIIEDNKKLAHNISEALIHNDYRTTWCATGTEALAAVQIQAFDVILLDLGLPDGDGIDLVESLRKHTPQAGIIIATARDKLEDRIKGLDRGGDDYLVKPFALAELLARVRALLRRTQTPSEIVPIEVCGITVDFKKRRVTINDEVLDFPPREYDLLVYLIENRREHVSREMLAREVWQVESRATSLNNVIDVHISRLRERLQPYGKDTLIKTIRGVGFTFDG